MWLARDSRTVHNSITPARGGHSIRQHPTRTTKKRLEVLLPFLAQRSLRCTQACFPATAHTGRFSLLCCQPEALFVSVAARTPLFTGRYPCGVHARPGHTISALSQDIHRRTAVHQPSSRLGDRRTLTHPAAYVIKMGGRLILTTHSALGGRNLANFSWAPVIDGVEIYFPRLFVYIELWTRRYFTHASTVLAQDL